ncbi:MAG: hypothetical protein CMN28_06480 [Salinisphaeraceae bacterium]|jgi:peptidyl-prolyl cis-trans isomerase SurA|nr:hypothetical protein [Salinisphaeraceae bacterium]
MKRFSSPRKLPRLGTALACLLWMLAGAPGTLCAQSLDRIVAVVNDGVILQSELDSAVVKVERRLGQQVADMPPEMVRSRVLDQLIMSKLQTQRAERAGLRVSDQQVNRALAGAAAQNGMQPNEFLSRLTREGVSVEEVRGDMREQLLLEEVKKREVYGRVSVTSEDVDRFLESEALRLKDNREYHIRHILIEAPDDASAQAIRAAEDRTREIRSRALDGESFGELAIAFSEGGKSLEGGDLGWLPGGYMPTLFADIVPTLQPGEVSRVFRGPGGFHLIKLEDVRFTEDAEQDEGPLLVEEVSAQHLMVETNELRDSARARDEIEKVRERLAAGDDFAELARQYSDDDASSNQGGDLGWVEASGYPGQFGRELNDLKAGEVSQPFQTDVGWHLVKVNERRERDRTEERIRARARQAIGERMAREEGETWLRRLRDEAYVEVRMDDYQGEIADGPEDS